MRKWLVPVLMTVSLVWQSLAMAQVGSALPTAAELMHSVLHWEAEGHHHHEDGSWHLDDSAESAQHVMCDHLSNPVALLQSAVRTATQGGQVTPQAHLLMGLPAPHLKGLLRPPRLI